MAVVSEIRIWMAGRQLGGNGPGDAVLWETRRGRVVGVHRGGWEDGDSNRPVGCFGRVQ